MCRIHAAGDTRRVGFLMAVGRMRFRFCAAGNSKKSVFSRWGLEEKPHCSTNGVKLSYWDAYTYAMLYDCNRPILLKNPIRSRT